MKIWGDLPLEDMVRVIRTYRPQVVINGWGGVHTGHGQHQASGILTPRAVQAAADPKAFPEQRSEGLLPWKVTLELRFAAGTLLGTAPPAPPGNAVELSVNEVSPLWGESYIEIGTEGHAAHRSQGTPAFFGNAFFRRPVYLVAENDEGGDAGAFDVKRLAEPIASLAGRFPELDAQIQPALASTERHLLAAGKFALELDRVATAKSLAAAGKEIAGLEARLRTANGGEAAAARWEIDRVHERIDQSAGRRHRAAGSNTGGSARARGRGKFFCGRALCWQAGRAGRVDARQVEPDPSFGLECDAGRIEGRQRYVAVQYPDSPGRDGPFLSGRSSSAVSAATRTAIARLSRSRATSSGLRSRSSRIAATTTGIETYPLELVPAVTLTVEPAAGHGAREECSSARQATCPRALPRYEACQGFGRARCSRQAGARSPSGHLIFQRQAIS